MELETSMSYQAEIDLDLMRRTRLPPILSTTLSPTTPHVQIPYFQAILQLGLGSIDLLRLHWFEFDERAQRLAESG